MVYRVHGHAVSALAQCENCQKFTGGGGQPRGRKPNLKVRVTNVLNFRHLFFGAVLQVQKILGGGSNRPPGCSTEDELGGQ